MSEIHSTAIIAPEARLGDNVAIGPFCIVGPDVEIGDNSVLKSHVVIEGHVKIGKNNQFYQFCSIGGPPQDESYKGEPTRVEIGDNNLFREYVTVNRATTKENGVTIVGNNCLIMSYVHIAHDCVIGNKVILVNLVNIAGHVHVGDGCIIGGGTLVSQFVSLGRGAYIGGASAINKDVPVFCTGYGNRIKLKGVNIIGMRRQGYSRQVIGEVVDFVRSLETSSLSPAAFVEKKELMNDFSGNEIITEIVNNIKQSQVGIAPFLS